MQQVSETENGAPALKEHDYIGLSKQQSSSLSTALVMNSCSADSGQLGLEETDLHLELGLGLGLGSGFAKKEGEIEATISPPLKPVPAPLDVARCLNPSASKNGAKRGYSETNVSVASPGIGKAEGDGSIVWPQGAFVPIWGASKPTVPVWRNENCDPPKGLSGRHEPHVFTDRKQDFVADEAPPAKDQAVGWPPVRSYRRQTLAKCSETYVKVNMDGITVGRKVDLNAYISYDSLLLALEDMFQPSNNAQGPHSARDHDVKHFLMSKGSDFVLTYEDKEGDWMLVGDVPWSMFVSTVRRLRITRGADVTGSGGHEKPRFHA